MAVRLISNFKQVTGAITKRLPQQCLRACHEVRNEWVRILAGARSGRRYKVPGTGTPGVRGSGTYYTASAPGEAPAPRLGSAGLRGSIRVMPRFEFGKAQARVGTELEYAIYLEYGTRYMDPRPSLGPALDKARPAIDRIFSERLI